MNIGVIAVRAFFEFSFRKHKGLRGGEEFSYLQTTKTVENYCQKIKIFRWRASREPPAHSPVESAVVREAT